MPTLIFTVIVICSYIADAALAGLLKVLLKNGEFGVSFAGMEQGFDLGKLFGEVQEGKKTLAQLELKGNKCFFSSSICHMSSFLLISRV